MTKALATLTLLLVLALAQDARAQEVDRQGDPLPPGALARLGTTRLRKGFLTYQAVFSPDGQRIASVGAGQGLCVWDAASGKAVFEAKPQSRAVAYAPDGALLACAWATDKGLE